MIRRALVTGGTRGIGAAIAKELHSTGLEVHITGTADHSDTSYIYHQADFSEPDSINSFVATLKNLNVDVLINNAGINKINPFEEISQDDFELIQRVNVLAPFKLCQAVLPHMKEMGWGRIVNISSIFGSITKELRSSYSASKFALDGMTASLAVEVAPFGILANCVAPGFIDTELTRRVLGAQGIKDLLERIPIQRLGQAHEIAKLVKWLCSEENTYLTAQNIVMDGGFTRV